MRDEPMNFDNGVHIVQQMGALLAEEYGTTNARQLLLTGSVWLLLAELTAAEAAAELRLLADKLERGERPTVN